MIHAYDKIYLSKAQNNMASWYSNLSFEKKRNSVVVSKIVY